MVVESKNSGKINNRVFTERVKLLKATENASGEWWKK